MNMKKSLALMILAGLLSASLASCVVKNPDDDLGTGNNTEPPYVQSQGPIVTTPLPTTDPTQVVYAPVNEVVYTIKGASLKLAADPAQTLPLGELTELTRTGKHSVWSKILYEGTEYYVASGVLTTDDLKEKNFVSCNKVMYVNVGSLNVRKYPSAPATAAESDTYFSKILTTLSLDAEVKVISEGTDWSKVEVKVGNDTVTGFVRSSYLSASKSSAAEKEYLDKFTPLANSVTMYVTTATANLRQHPYADNRGTLMPGVEEGLKQGTAVTVIAEGVVDEHAWCMINWAPTPGSAARKGYISKSCLSLTQVGEKATLEDMLAAYPNLVKFDAAKTLYTTDSVFGRSNPSFLKNSAGKDDNVVKSLDAKATKVKAVAYGTLPTIDEDGTTFNMMWVLVEDETIGYYFVSYSVLTPLSSGDPAQLPISLEQLMEAYQFTALNASVTTKIEVKGYTVPDSDAKSVTIPSGTALTVKAQGKTGDAFLSQQWYIVEYDGGLYFVVNDPANFN